MDAEPQITFSEQPAPFVLDAFGYDIDWNNVLVDTRSGETVKLNDGNPLKLHQVKGINYEGELVVEGIGPLSETSNPQLND